MIYYTCFIMDSETRRLLLFHTDHHREWQAAHSDYCVVPPNAQENSYNLRKLFSSRFVYRKDEQPRVIDGIESHTSLCLLDTDYIGSVFDLGQILPWDLEDITKLNLDPRTRRAIKANIGLLMFFLDTDRDIWTPLQDFAHAPSR